MKTLLQFALTVPIVALLVVFQPLPAMAGSRPTPVGAVPAEGTSAQQSHPSGAAMAADALLVRPLGVAATAIGAALFLVSVPFTAITGNVGESAHALIIKPARMTFSRPLGRFKQHHR